MRHTVRQHFQGLLAAAFAASALLTADRTAVAASPEMPEGRPAGERAAEPAPASPVERAKLLESLYESLAVAPSADAALPITRAIEELWLFSGSPTADLLVQRAISATAAGNRELALRFLDVAVELKPDFAEGWNRRAFVHYMGNDFERALGDLRRVLALDPHHYKALDGLAHILREIGEKRAAREALKKLLAVHPNAEGASQALEEITRELEGQGI